MDNIRIDNFGGVGTRLLLGWMGVCEAPEDFCRRSIAEGWIPKIGRMTGVIERGPGITWIRTRVVSHVHYNLKAQGLSLRVRRQQRMRTMEKYLAIHGGYALSRPPSTPLRIAALAVSSASSTELSKHCQEPV